jgi:asparagine synthase (glutamine-hydrolysing)
VLRHWRFPRQALGLGLANPGGGNLRKQLLEPSTLLRLGRSILQARDWRSLYFSNFAKVSERSWLRLLDPELVSRENCWQTFVDGVARSGARTPAAQAMHWDMQTYLPGLFHQDDRMSMNRSLESRVPLADPRLVKFAFRIPFDQKFRAGSSKWLLRQVVSDVLPAEVVNRRKVGFDTPAERWMREVHAGFVRETLLSSRARQRGWLRPAGVEALLDAPGSTYWFDRAWKLLCLELWAQAALDGRRPVHAAAGNGVAEVHSRAANGEPGRPAADEPGPVARAARLLRAARDLANEVWPRRRG